MNKVNDVQEIAEKSQS